jgi:hypothetical protein
VPCAIFRSSSVCSSSARPWKRRRRLPRRNCTTDPKVHSATRNSTLKGRLPISPKISREHRTKLFYSVIAPRAIRTALWSVNCAGSMRLQAFSAPGPMNRITRELKFFTEPGPSAARMLPSPVIRRCSVSPTVPLSQRVNRIFSKVAPARRAVGYSCRTEHGVPDSYRTPFTALPAVTRLND